MLLKLPRLGFLVLNCIAAASVSTGCDASADQPEALPASAVPVAPSPSSFPQPAESAAPLLDPPLTTNAADLVLIPPMSGVGPGRTPAFEVEREKYTVRVACHGGKTVRVSGERGSVKVPCDDATRRVHVATPTKRVSVSIAASPTQKWSVSVVVTDDFSTVSPTPTSAFV